MPVPTYIPEVLPFAFELAAAIDTDTAAAGDRFAGRLTMPLRNGRMVIAPKGARIEGRISDLEMGFYPKEAVLIGLIPESIEIHGVKTPFAATLDTRRDVVAKEVKGRKGLEFLLPHPGQHAHLFRFPGSHNVMQKGFTSYWLTVRK